MSTNVFSTVLFRSLHVHMKQKWDNNVQLTQWHTWTLGNVHSRVPKASQRHKSSNNI